MKKEQEGIGRKIVVRSEQAPSEIVWRLDLVHTGQREVDVGLHVRPARTLPHRQARWRPTAILGERRRDRRRRAAKLRRRLEQRVRTRGELGPRATEPFPFRCDRVASHFCVRGLLVVLVEASWGSPGRPAERRPACGELLRGQTAHCTLRTKRQASFVASALERPQAWQGIVIADALLQRDGLVHVGVRRARSQQSGQ